MYESGSKINEALKAVLQGVDESDKVLILDTMIRFGQVAKFRCRSNVAYENFVNACFKDIATIIREKPEHLDFEILRVKEVL